MEKFIEILESINGTMLELKQVLLQKQAALVHGKHAEIAELISREHELMAQIATFEKERIAELDVIKEKYSITDETNRLDDLIPVISLHLSEDESAKLLSIRSAVKINSRLVKRINSQNGELVNNVRHFIKVLFTNIRDNKNSCLVNARV